MSKYFQEDRIIRYTKILWGLVLFTLPLTTFRYIPSFYGSTSVKPLALYPLALLFPLLLLLRLRSKSFHFPRVTFPLIAFLLIAAAATLIGLLYAPLELRGQTVGGRALRAWISVAVGLIFFLSAFWMNRSTGDLKHSLKWMYTGLIAVIVWGGVQIVANNTSLLSKSLIGDIQLTFSLRALPSNDRISAFAFEPSWLADQVVILYYPWLLAALLSGYRLTRYRWLEPLLLLGATVMLIFTFSRGGVLIALITTALVMIIAGRNKLRDLWSWLLSPFFHTESGSQTPARLLRTVVLVIVILAVVSAAILFSQNRYFSSFLEFDTTNSLFEYMLDVSAGPRLAYAASGLAIYSDYPWLGVGLGASSLYLYDYLPDWALTNLPEVNRRLSPDSNVVTNTKNLYVRLLAETGLLGFWLFIAFYASLLAEVRTLFTSSSTDMRFVAIAALFIWLAVAMRNFTQDSLTFPLMWSGFGIVLGLASSARST